MKWSCSTFHLCKREEVVRGPHQLYMEPSLRAPCDMFANMRGTTNHHTVFCFLAKYLTTSRIFLLNLLQCVGDEALVIATGRVTVPDLPVA